MKTALLHSLFILLLFSCNQEKSKEQTSPFLNLEVPAGNSSSLPYLTKGPDNTLYLSWVENAGDTVIMKYASLENGNWSTPIEIARGTDWFANWADYPMISVTQNGQMLAHYLAKSSSGTYSYDVHMKRSSDGKTWSDDFIPHTDGTPTEHGFVTMLPEGNDFRAAWLDGRNTGGEDHDSPTGHGAMTVRSALIKSDGSIADEAELDVRVCDCCQTGGAITSNGPVIVYRDRSEEEIRDMSIVRLVEGQWSSPQTISADNWKIAGCPVNGPRAAAVKNNLAVAWFSAPNEKSVVQVIFSNDGGETFGEPIVLDNTGPLGRVDVAMLDETTAVVSWLDKGTNDAEIKIATVTLDGEVLTQKTVTAMSASRKSGFPQMEVVGQSAYFAWAHLSDSSSQVKMAKVSL